MADRYLVECDKKPCCDYGTNDYHFKDAQIVKLRPDQIVMWSPEISWT